MMRGEAMAKQKGTLCCGPCTFALWRHIALGRLGDYAKNLNAGLSKLDTKQDGVPVFYTLSALAEVHTLPNAQTRIEIRAA
jgi:hypothetical protein